jgi:hypothetical protein
VTARLLYCDFGCVVDGAVLDGAALGFAFALACFFFFGAVFAPGVAGGARVSCWASTSDSTVRRSTTESNSALDYNGGQHRGGGHREPSGQSCKQKYFSTRN